MDHTQDLVQHASVILIFTAAGIAIASAALQLRVVDRHSTMSLHLLSYMSVVAAVLTLTCIRIIVGDTWWFALLRLGAFALFVAVMAWRLHLQIQAQLPWRKDRP